MPCLKPEFTCTNWCYRYTGVDKPSLGLSFSGTECLQSVGHVADPSLSSSRGSYALCIHPIEQQKLYMADFCDLFKRIHLTNNCALLLRLKIHGTLTCILPRITATFYKNPSRVNRACWLHLCDTPSRSTCFKLTDVLKQFAWFENVNVFHARTILDKPIPSQAWNRHYEFGYYAAAVWYTHVLLETYILCVIN